MSSELLYWYMSSFKSGICVGHTFVCAVLGSSRTTCIKHNQDFLNDQNVHGCNKPTYHKLQQGGNDVLWIYTDKECYIPAQLGSINFLCTKLGIVCAIRFTFPCLLLHSSSQPSAIFSTIRCTFALPPKPLGRIDNPNDKFSHPLLQRSSVIVLNVCTILKGQ
jgi:hypothetical protein